MPRIPLADRPRQNVMGVPQQGSSSRSSALVAQAWGDIGRNLTQIGGELIERRVQADAVNFTAQAEMDALIFSSEKEKELQMKFSSDPAGYKDAYTKEIKNFFDAKAKQAPNSRAQLQLSQRSSDYLAKSTLMADSWENKRKLEVAGEKIQLKSDEMRKAIVNNPNPEKALEMVNTVNNAILENVNVLYGEQQAQQMVKQNGSAFAGSVFEGKLIAKDFRGGLQLLDDKNPHPMFEYVTPEQQQKYKKLFENGLAQLGAENKAKYGQDLKNVLDTLVEGNNVDESTLQSVAQRAQALGDTDGIDDLKEYMRAQSIMQDIKNLPADQARKRAGEFAVDDSGVFNKQGRRGLKEKFATKANLILEQKENSPADFFTNNDIQINNLATQAGNLDDRQAMHNYVRQIESTKQAQGITNPQILSSELVKVYSKQLTSANGEDVNRYLTNIEAAFSNIQGSDDPSVVTNKTGQVLFDLYQNSKDFKETHLVASSIQNPEARADMFDKLKNSAAITENFRILVKTEEEDRKEINDLFTTDEFKNFAVALDISSANGGNAFVRQGFSELLQLDYKEKRSKGIDASNAKKMAIKEVIQSNYSIALGRNSAVIIPAQIQQTFGVKPDTVEDFLVDSLGGLGVDKLNIRLPDAYKSDSFISGDKTERYYSDLRSTGVWVTNNAQDGLMLKRKNTNTGELERVYDKDGRDLEIKYSKIPQFMQDIPKRYPEFEDPNVLRAGGL